MNANELADELQKMFVGEEYDRIVHEIPEFLRQQQAEIEALKAKTLTDEEISNIRDEFLTPKDCDIYTFARAILRKAQEK